MKKSLLYIVACATITLFGFIACGDDDKDEPKGQGSSADCETCEILGFATTNPMSVGQINPDEGTIVCSAPIGTDLSSVSPIIVVPDGVCVNPDSGEKQDFSDNKSVTYTVTYGDCVKTYDVKFEEKGSTPTPSPTPTSGCNDYKYDIKQGFVTYVDHFDNDKIIYYIFDDYGEKEYIYMLCEDCGEYVYTIYDNKAKKATSYAHSDFNGKQCKAGTSNIDYDLQVLHFNRSTEISRLLALGKLVGASAIKETIANKDCEGVEFGELKLLQYKCVLLYVEGEDESFEAKEFSETIPTNKFPQLN